MAYIKLLPYIDNVAIREVSEEFEMELMLQNENLNKVYRCTDSTSSIYDTKMVYVVVSAT